MPEPTLSDVHADLVGRLEQDKRLRALEQAQAAAGADMRAVKDELSHMRAEAKEDKAELLAAIRENKPASPWPAVSAMAAVLGLMLILAAAIYGQ